MDRALKTMDEIQHLRAQAERYYRLAKQINDPRVIAALHAMAEETEEAIVALKTAARPSPPASPDRIEPKRLRPIVATLKSLDAMLFRR
jgi:hypothetical protein